MANIKSAIKRAKTSEKQRQHNVALRSSMRTAIKKVVAASEAGDAEAANAAFKTAEPEIDSMVNKGLIHGNKASRTKSRLNKRIRAIGA
ncbi:MAG: 30S ribosomal protein S20 [Chromatiales bacterium]|nr:30S ribosomal protein S20 [Chromatiales bacterium]